MDRQQPDYVAVGIVERSRGLRGQVKVKPLTDEPARFERLRDVRVELVSGEAKHLHIRAVTIRGASVYLHFDEIDNKDKADGLAGAYINIRYDEIDGHYFPVEAVRTTSMAGVVHIYKADVESLRINQEVPPDVFKFKLEPGTFVWDYVLDVEYVFPPDASLNIDIGELLAEAPERSESIEVPPASSPGPTPRGTQRSEEESKISSGNPSSWGKTLSILGALLIIVSATAYFTAKARSK